MAVRVLRAINLSCAVGVTVALLLLLGAGGGPVPPLGRALVPGGGVWASAAAPTAVRDESLELPGLSRPAKVSFTAEGYTSVEAATDGDLFLAQGYVTARMRLMQMDLQRRLGKGRLSELTGAAGLASDKFELRLGLLRTAQAKWAATPRDSEAGRALTAYARGVNAWLGRVRASGEWPAIYGLTGVRPEAWTPVDSLVVQEVLTQQLNFTTTQLDYALLRRSLGPELTMSWFPVHAVTPQQPYDPGPYKALPPAPLPVRNANAAGSAAAAPGPRAAPDGQVPRAAPDEGVLPDSARHLRFDSNAWAMNGPAVAGGRAMLAGDPHLQVSLPSYWFQVSLRSPGYQVAGGSLPGLPAVMLGHNAHISWSLTNAQTNATLFYTERTSPARPDSYYWKGAWRSVEKAHYEIPVRGGSPVPLTVDLTVHGPMMTLLGQKVSVTWTGDYPANDLEALLAVDRASDFAAFRNALRGWKAPALNFVYADDRGHIGIVCAGLVPQTPGTSEPWLPLSGAGADDVVGTIPFEALPQIYDPPGHLVVSTNERPVDDDYPYFIGTSLNFDPGYRQSVIRGFLRDRREIGPSDFAELQHNVTDGLAGQLVPEVLKSLGRTKLDGRERAARDLLARWNQEMDSRSPAASIWWTFLDAYLHKVFQPWWDVKKVPVSTDKGTLGLQYSPIPLREALQHWSLHDPGNAAFTPPGGARRDAPQVMRAAFGSAVATLAGKLGPEPATWTWGRLHKREIPAMTGARGLGYGPYADGGDAWTVNAADGLLTSSFGPSWRMIAQWTGQGRITATAIYPGGQSDTPTSSWYRNLVPLWRDERYLPLTPPAGTRAWRTWTLRPGA